MAMIFEAGPEDDVPLQASRDLDGTPVEDAEGLAVGTVFGALAEAATGLLRYLDLQMESRPRHVLVPIGHTRIAHRRGRLRVKLKAANRNDLEEIPAFDPEADDLSGDFQEDLLDAFSRVYYGERYYAHPAYDHSALFAGEHPISYEAEDPAAGAGEPESHPAPSPLAPLSALPGYRVAAGEPDIRGWTVVAAGGAALGTVEELIVEAGAGKVRYVAVTTGDGRPPALLPIGFLGIDRSEGTVHAPALAAADLAALPRHRPDEALTRAGEDAIHQALARAMAGPRRFHRPDFRGGAADPADDA
jgi:photosynthetic reaction center H subunit